LSTLFDVEARQLVRDVGLDRFRRRHVDLSTLTVAVLQLG
jgi:hypothetical protein